MKYNMHLAVKEYENKPTIIFINMKNMANKENTLESIQFASIVGANAGRIAFYIQSISIFCKEGGIFINHTIINSYH